MALTKAMQIVDVYQSATNPQDTKEVAQTYPDAYVMILSVSGKSQLKATVCVYADATKRQLLRTSVCEFPANMDGPNFIRQGYEYLKTLPEFAGAADC